MTIRTNHHKIVYFCLRFTLFTYRYNMMCFNEVFTQFSRRKIQKMDYLKLGFNTMDASQLVFSNINNEFMQPPKVGKILDSIIKKNNLKRITAHGFRHTHCSILFEAGASLKEVQDRLGHSDIQTTMNIYTHVTEKAKQKTAEKFASYVNF